MNTIDINKEWDLSSFNELFNSIMTPEQLRDELVEVVFDYASKVDEGETELFKSNIGTLYVVYNALRGVR